MKLAFVVCAGVLWFGAAAAAEENKFQADLNPFDRGPEFTETR